MSTAPASRSVTEFESWRARLIGLGYRMLGSRAAAEDLAQETWLRWHGTPRGTIRDPGAWLRATMTRLCIDELRARRARREQYVGPWLPEPWVGEATDSVDAIELAGDLSNAFMLLLERLAPEERAAFLLHEVFDADHAEIAGLLGKSQAAVRQIVSRARARVASDRPRFQPTRQEQAALARRFVEAVASRDHATLVALFAADATLVSDGGGKAAAARRPIVGAERIARFFLGVVARHASAGTALDPCRINASPGFIVRARDGSTIATLCFEVGDGRIRSAWMVRNPDKLVRLAP
ncbi:MAG: RNA polymerase sigma factor SigJ [Gammaproteobacteria bacterium]